MGFVAGSVTLGVDLAKEQDYTALSAARRRAGGGYDIPFLQRLPHGLTFRQIAATIAAAARRVPLPAGQRLRLLADSTGVGAPVVELVREALCNDPVDVLAVTFTGGDGLRWGPERVTVGKVRLVRTLQGLLTTGQLHLPPGALSTAVRQEFRAYAQKLLPSGHTAYGAMQAGEHDDLLTALMLSVLDADDPAPPARDWLPGWEQGLVTSRTERARRQAPLRRKGRR